LSKSIFRQSERIHPHPGVSIRPRTGKNFNTVIITGIKRNRLLNLASWQ